MAEGSETSGIFVDETPGDPHIPHPSLSKYLTLPDSRSNTHARTHVNTHTGVYTYAFPQIQTQYTSPVSSPLYKP